MEEELGVLGDGKLLPPCENEGGLRGLNGQRLLVKPLLAWDEDDPIGAYPRAVFEQTFRCALPVVKHLRTEIQLAEGANSDSGSRRR